MNILYTMENTLYVNITNQCPCRCTFCIRIENDGISENESLWLEREPSIDEIKNEFKKYDLNEFNEVVFCGYGEPLVRLDAVVEVSKYIKTISDIKIRVNTNGLSDLIHSKKTSILLKDNIDAISISLNAPNKEVYNDIVKPKYGIKSFDAMISFAKDCKKYINEVNLSIVDDMDKEYIKDSISLAKELNIKLKIRKKI